MRKVFLIATALFWLAIAALGVRALTHPPASAPASAERLIGPAEMARHHSPGDCWLAIDGAVYDLSVYLPQHPAEPAVLAGWCGKEASAAYRTKNKGRPHSAYADQLLPRFRIGSLESTR